jgi:hypothetical protein
MVDAPREEYAQRFLAGLPRHAQGGEARLLRDNVRTATPGTAERDERIAAATQRQRYRESSIPIRQVF